MRITYALCAIILLCVMAVGASALEITTNPLYPTSATPVSITAETLFNDCGQTFLNASYTRNGYSIVMDVMMEDLHGSGMVFAQWVTYDGGTVEVGLLPDGWYSVTANMYMQPWQRTEPQYLYGSTTSNFYVAAPEPSSFMAMFCGMAALGGVLRLRKR